MRLAAPIVVALGLFASVIICHAGQQNSGSNRPAEKARREDKRAGKQDSRDVTQKEFYVDPVNGSSSGDGSAARPWRTLAEVIDAKLISGDNPSKGQVHGGDTVYLLSGNHGSVRLSSDNTDFITIQAASGHQPVLNGLLMYSGSKWAFKGLTFRNPAQVPQYNYLARMTPVNDLIFTGNLLESETDSSAWTPNDWGTKCSSGISYTGSRAAITDNVIRNVQRGVVIGGDSILLSNNLVDCYVDDGIDFTSGNTIIRSNTVINHYGQVLDGNHNDGIQGWALDGIPRTNLILDSNVVIESTGAYAAIPPIPSGLGQDYIQGISIFDGDWSNVIVTNNVVVASAYHGLSFYGLKDSILANNTVVKASSNSNMDPWIGLFVGKTGTQPTNVVVRNNIAHRFNLTLVAGAIHDHNISILPMDNWTQIPGSYSGVDPVHLFVNFNPAISSFDFNLVRNSPAIGGGIADGAPALDIRGRLRKPTAIDIGAFAR